MSDRTPEAEPQSPDTGDLSFEEALQRLEQVVEELEGGQMALEESLRRFEEGMALRAACLERLQQAEMKIEQVLAEADEEAEAAADVRPEDEA